jgi:hypothetical protein
VIRVGLFDFNDNNPKEVSATDYERIAMDFSPNGSNQSEVTLTTINEWGVVNYIRVFKDYQVIGSGFITPLFISQGDTLEILANSIVFNNCNASGYQVTIEEDMIFMKIDFTVNDWYLSAGYYRLDLQHNLDTFGISPIIYNSNQENQFTLTDSINVPNQNTVRLTIPAVPDERFPGYAIIGKVGTA